MWLASDRLRERLVDRQVDALDGVTWTMGARCSSPPAADDDRGLDRIAARRAALFRSPHFDTMRWAHAGLPADAALPPDGADVTVFASANGPHDALPAWAPTHWLREEADSAEGAPAIASRDANGRWADADGRELVARAPYMVWGLARPVSPDPRARRLVVPPHITTKNAVELAEAFGPEGPLKLVAYAAAPLQQQFDKKLF